MTAKSLFSIFLVFCLSLTGFGQTVGPQEKTSTPKQWQGKYQLGTEKLEKGNSMKISVTEQSLTFEGDKGFKLAIPVAKVTEVSYDNRARRRYGTAIPLMVLTPLAALLLFSKGTKHFINIAAKDEGNEKELVFQIDKNDYRPFLDELEKVAGLKHKNIVAERMKIQEELKVAKNQNVALQLNKSVRVNETDLKPGPYQFVCLEREGGKGEIYFFTGNKVNPGKVAASANIEIIAQTNPSTAADVDYKEAGGFTLISEIRLPAKTVKFP